jgi:hypothetical protein
VEVRQPGGVVADAALPTDEDGERRDVGVPGDGAGVEAQRGARAEQPDRELVVLQP